MIEQMPFGNNVEFVDNPQPRCPCVLVLDTSASMTGAPIRELQAGLEQYREELMRDSLARQRVEIALVTFGGAVKVAHSFSTADGFEVPPLQPSGNTPMAAALAESVKLVERRKQEYKAAGLGYYRPWIFLITDGEPTDNAIWSAAVEELKRGTKAKSYILFAVGVEDANMEKLRELPALNGPQKLNGTRFTDLFLWLSQSQKSVSRSSPNDQISLPAPQWVINT
jgi:uncharacterized protein YegL